MENSVFVKCDCCCSVLEVEHDVEMLSNVPSFNVSIWKSYNKPFSIKERLRWCYRILKTGNPWADHTILTTEDALKVANFIIEKTNPYAEAKEKIGK